MNETVSMEMEMEMELHGNGKRIKAKEREINNTQFSVFQIEMKSVHNRSDSFSYTVSFIALF